MDDLIRRSDAIDALRDAEDHAFNSYYEGLKKAHKIIAELPSAQQSNVVIPHRNYEYLSDFWCECGWHLGRKGIVNFCANCGKAVKWDG